MITGSIKDHCSSDKSLGYGLRSLTSSHHQIGDRKPADSARTHTIRRRQNNSSSRTALSAANTYDSQALKPMLSHFHMGHESHAADSKAPVLHAGKAYDIPGLRKWLRGKRIGVRIARKGMEPSERLGRRRWVIEPARSLEIGGQGLARTDGSAFSASTASRSPREMGPG